VRLGQDLAMEILALVLSVGGVTAIVLVCWLAGGARTAVIADAEAARIQLQYDEPTFQAAHVLVAGDGRTALLANDSGTDVAAVMVFGDKFVTRRFARGAIRKVELRQQPAGSVMTVRIDDLTCRRIDVVLDRGGADRAGGVDGVDFWLSAMERLSQGAQASQVSGHPARIRTEEA
jgi:hypothetical protein